MSMKWLPTVPWNREDVGFPTFGWAVFDKKGKQVSDVQKTPGHAWYRFIYLRAPQYSFYSEAEYINQVFECSEEGFTCSRVNYVKAVP